tara:strand:+ start:512 stop:1357 length:846 start_codon:yes stop_codon:yes gene_type:complete
LNKISKRQRNRRPLGQHFLHDEAVLTRIASLVKPSNNIVLEIGPGTGNLTELLLDKGFEVYAIEIDSRLVKKLANKFDKKAINFERLRVLEGDARSYDLTEVLKDKQYSVVANLPYYAANPIIRRFLESNPKPENMVVMLQREVAREMVAEGGKFSILGISVQLYAKVSFLFDVLPEAFSPPPSVVSSVLYLELRSEPLVPFALIPDFFTLIKGVFKNPRKQLHNALLAAPWAGDTFGLNEARVILERAKVDSSRRPETLSIEEWILILEEFTTLGIKLGD